MITNIVTIYRLNVDACNANALAKRERTSKIKTALEMKTTPTMKKSPKRKTTSKIKTVPKMKSLNPIPYGISIPGIHPPAKNTLRSDIFQFSFTYV